MTDRSLAPAAASRTLGHARGSAIDRCGNYLHALRISPCGNVHTARSLCFMLCRLSSQHERLPAENFRCASAEQLQVRQMAMPTGENPARTRYRPKRRRYADCHESASRLEDPLRMRSNMRCSGNILPGRGILSLSSCSHAGMEATGRWVRFAAGMRDSWRAPKMKGNL